MAKKKKHHLWLLILLVGLVGIFALSFATGLLFSVLPAQDQQENIRLKVVDPWGNPLPCEVSIFDFGISNTTPRETIPASYGFVTSTLQYKITDNIWLKIEGTNIVPTWHKLINLPKDLDKKTYIAYSVKQVTTINGELTVNSSGIFLVLVNNNNGTGFVPFYDPIEKRFDGVVVAVSLNDSIDTNVSIGDLKKVTNSDNTTLYVKYIPAQTISYVVLPDSCPHPYGTVFYFPTNADISNYVVTVKIFIYADTEKDGTFEDAICIFSATKAP